MKGIYLSKKTSRSLLIDIESGYVNTLNDIAVFKDHYVVSYGDDPDNDCFICGKNKDFKLNCNYMLKFLGFEETFKDFIKIGDL
jgi:hypothetical protein